MAPREQRVTRSDETVDADTVLAEAEEGPKEEAPREIGTVVTESEGRRFEIRKDGSIAYFSTEAAVATIGREIGSPTL